MTATTTKSHEKRHRAWTAAAVVGVDAGKGHHVLVVRARGRKDSRPLQVPTTRPGFEEAVAFILAQAGGAAPADILVGIEFAGNYGFTFAHYLAARGFQVVSVLAKHSKSWKDVMHGQPLKTDAKDALSITDLAAQGHFVAFPFLKPAYAELRYLVSAREAVVSRHSATINRIRAVLQVVFPEFEQVFGRLTKKTPRAFLQAYPGPGDLLAAPKADVLALLDRESRGHLGEARYVELVTAARSTLALDVAQGALKAELPLLVERLQLYDRQKLELERQMQAVLATLPEAAALCTIPGVAPVSAAVFLGAIGDPTAYASSREVLKLAGLGLLEKSSGASRGKPRLSKRGRPMLRQMAYMLAVRSIRVQDRGANGLYWRGRYEAALARNGGLAKKALVMLMRDLIKRMYVVARECRPYTVEPPIRPTPSAPAGDAPAGISAAA
jgi:transposase